MTDRVEIVGWTPAAADLNRWAAELGPAVDRAALAVAQQAAGAVRAAVPHRSGRLAGSVAVTVEADGVAVTMGTGVPYAGWVEYGGSRGRPYDADGRYLWPTVARFDEPYQQVAASTASSTAERFPWSKA